MAGDFILSKIYLISLLRSARLPFLILSPISILLGIAVAIISGASVSLIDSSLILLAALGAHISVNAFNEYHDFRSGLDFRTEKTPFSGGSGSLVDNGKAAPQVKILAWVSLLLTVLIGVYFLLIVGWRVAPIGCIGVLLILLYTPYLNRSPWLCLLAPGIGFGLLMVIGTHLVLAGTYSELVVLVSLVPFFLANNLLLLNQLPDIEADKSVGRRHLSIVYGIRTSKWVYIAFTCACCVCLAYGTGTGILPISSLLALLPLSLAFFVAKGAFRFAAQTTNLQKYLGLNVFMVMSCPTILAITLIASRQ